MAPARCRAFPRVFVAEGTHGLYPAPASPGTGFSKQVPFFGPEDASGKHCGASELLDKSLEDLDDQANDTWVDEPGAF